MIFGFALIIIGCNDPNESNVSDGIDFKSSSVEHDRVNVITDVIFYGNYNSKEFFYYFDHNNTSGAEYLVRCGGEAFTVAKGSGDGAYNEITYSGTPTVNGVNYHLEFPLSAIGLNGESEFTTKYWFFEITEQDRMPDSDTELLTNIL